MAIRTVSKGNNVQISVPFTNVGEQTVAGSLVVQVLNQADNSIFSQYQTPNLSSDPGQQVTDTKQVTMSQAGTFYVMVWLSWTDEINNTQTRQGQAPDTISVPATISLRLDTIVVTAV